MDCAPVEKQIEKLEKLQDMENENEENPNSSQKTNFIFSILNELKELFIGGFLNVYSYFLSIFGGMNEKQLGIDESDPDNTRDRVYSYSKRKRLDETENESETQNCEEELKMKKWRPDVVLLAVERFIYNLLGDDGEKETTENENNKDENDENMNSFVSAEDVHSPGGVSVSFSGDKAWSKRPNINFFSDSVIDDINDVDEEGDTSSAPSPAEVGSLEKNAPKLFVFSADKQDKEDKEEKEVTDGEIEAGEDVISPFPTFEERQAYFAEQILIQEAEASKGRTKSESPEKK